MGKEKKGRYRKRGQGGSLWVMGGLFTVLFVAVWAWSVWAAPSRKVAGLQTFPDEGRDHVAPGTVLTYKTDPPTSGTHYGTVTTPGFYTEAQPEGEVVHGLEHGYVVAYYDPADTPTNVIEALKGYAEKYTGQWDGVVVLPREQPEEVVLTAWRQMLRLDSWDKEQAEAFIDSFRGRGPENPVR